MEGVRKPKIIHYLLVAVILVTAVVSIPSTTAKYSTQKNYRISIETLIPYRYILKVSKIANSPGKSTTIPAYTAEESGYYAFIIKGGNGAGGLYSGSNSVGPADNAGPGGVIYGCVYLNKNEVLNIYVGSSASDPYRVSSGNNPDNSNIGINSLSVGSGGSGGHYRLGLVNSKNTSGAGGGATVLTVGTGTSSKLIAVAGGGGGGGGCDKGYLESAIVGGDGGSGGNMNSTKNTTLNTNLVVYQGYDGTAPSRPSNSGTASITNTQITQSRGNWSGGVGKNAATRSFGGGGGGGYTGGNGGYGSGYNGLILADDQAGGGGGGSSCIVKSNSGNNSRALKTAELSKIYELVSSDYSISQREGFAIIAYIENGTDASAISSYSSGTIS